MSIRLSHACLLFLAAALASCSTVRPDRLTDQKSAQFVAELGLDHSLDAAAYEKLRGGKVAVLPFLGPDASEWSAPEQIATLRNTIAEEFSLTLGQLGHFTMIERLQIDKVIAEQDFPANRIDDSQAVEIGKILGASAVVVGSLSDVLNVRMVDTVTSQQIWNSRSALSGILVPAVRRIFVIEHVYSLSDATLGVRFLMLQHIVPAERAAFNLLEEAPLVVAEVMPFSSAGGALQVGDQLRYSGRRQITGMPDLKSEVIRNNSSGSLNLTIFRDAKSISVSVPLTPRE